MRALTEMGLPVKIDLMPNEIFESIRFDRDEQRIAPTIPNTPTAFGASSCNPIAS